MSDHRQQWEIDRDEREAAYRQLSLSWGVAEAEARRRASEEERQQVQARARSAGRSGGSGGSGSAVAGGGMVALIAMVVVAIVLVENGSPSGTEGSIPETRRTDGQKPYRSQWDAEPAPEVTPVVVGSPRVESGPAAPTPAAPEPQMQVQVAPQPRTEPGVGTAAPAAGDPWNDVARVVKPSPSSKRNPGTGYVKSSTGAWVWVEDPGSVDSVAWDGDVDENGYATGFGDLVLKHGSSVVGHVRGMMEKGRFPGPTHMINDAGQDNLIFDRNMVPRPRR